MHSVDNSPMSPNRSYLADSPNNSQLLTVSGFEEVLTGNKYLIFYTIELKKTNKWVKKTLQDFGELEKALKQAFPDFTKLYVDILVKLETSFKIDGVRASLDNYLQTLSARADIMTSELINNFLEPSTKHSEAHIVFPRLLGGIEYQDFSVVDFHYQGDQNLFFAAHSDPNFIDRMQTYISNMKMPWERFAPPDNSKKVVSVVEGYVQEERFRKLWVEKFFTQILFIHWSKSLSSVFVVLDNFSVVIIKVDPNSQFTKTSKGEPIKLHTKRITGLYFDEVSHCIYTVSEDRTFKIYSLKEGKFVSETICGEVKLTSLVVDEKSKRVFITDSLRTVLIYDISNPKEPVLIRTFQHSKEAQSNKISLGNIKRHVRTLSMTSLQKAEKEQNISDVTTFINKNNSKNIAWSTLNGQLYAPNPNGAINIVQPKAGSMVYGLDAHKGEITRLKLYEDEHILVTGGKDKLIRFYDIEKEKEKGNSVENLDGK